MGFLIILSMGEAEARLPGWLGRYSIVPNLRLDLLILYGSGRVAR